MTKLIESFKYAIHGIKIVFGTETNMKIHLGIASLVVIIGVILSINLTEWILCILCFGLVIGMEMINTSVEYIVDLVSPNYHPLAGKIKDIAAGAVLICAILSVIIGILIFLPKILTLLS